MVCSLWQWKVPKKQRCGSSLGSSVCLMPLFCQINYFYYFKIIKAVYRNPLFPPFLSVPAVAINHSVVNGSLGGCHCGVGTWQGFGALTVLANCDWVLWPLLGWFVCLVWVLLCVLWCLRDVNGWPYPYPVQGYFTVKIYTTTRCLVIFPRLLFIWSYSELNKK